MINSRLDSQKAVWIEKAIDFCVKNNLFLDIYWNGEYLASLRKKFKKENKIKFLWFKKQEEIDYKKYDLIFAMWRALLEWISNWLVWILLGYDDLICPISEQDYAKIEVFESTLDLSYFRAKLQKNKILKLQLKMSRKARYKSRKYLKKQRKSLWISKKWF